MDAHKSDNLTNALSESRYLNIYTFTIIVIIITRTIAFLIYILHNAEFFCQRNWKIRNVIKSIRDISNKFHYIHSIPSHWVAARKTAEETLMDRKDMENAKNGIIYCSVETVKCASARMRFLFMNNKNE